MIAACLLFFPKLALGLSGFETGVAVMPLVKGDPDDDPHKPAGRIRNTQKLLAHGGGDHVVHAAGFAHGDHDADHARGAGHRRAGRRTARWRTSPTATRR